MDPHSTKITSSDQVVQWLKTQCQSVRLDYQDEKGYREYILEWAPQQRAGYFCKGGEYTFIAKFINLEDDHVGKQWMFDTQDKMTKAFTELMEYVSKVSTSWRYENYYYSD